MWQNCSQNASLCDNCGKHYSVCRPLCKSWGVFTFVLVCFFARGAHFPHCHCLNGLVVKAFASRAEDTGFESCLRCDFSGLSHTSDSKIGTPVATLPGAWRYRVSTGTGQPGVSILRLGEVESLICNFYINVAAHAIA